MNTKKTISILAVTMFMAGTILSGCKSDAQKEEAAEEDVQEAKQDLKEVRNDANAEALKVADAEEWKTFKLETEAKIKNNEIRIAELKVKIQKPAKLLDEHHANRIEKLEQKNRDLKTRMDDYEKNQSDWETFKREFNHDMDELGQSLKDFTVDNKN